MIILKEFLWRIIEWFYEKMQEFGELKIVFNGSVSIG